MFLNEEQNKYVAVVPYSILDSTLHDNPILCCMGLLIIYLLCIHIYTGQKKIVHFLRNCKYRLWKKDSFKTDIKIGKEVKGAQKM